MTDYEDDISIDDEIYSEGGDSYYTYDAEAEWEETKEQFNALFSLVVFPFVGRWLGKKFSFWLWSRYSTTPKGTSFLSLQWVNDIKRIAQ
ncbi:hypothetical protein BDA99DRAFT_497917 [Phascolomyces articulosus]|uniref:Uncharacterized protein n=1 Tax=Phascolomyces articulosus TaxID=60185 RepID=A0AAD5KL89_9FUNG|nr:hypothetical protein BDA99DRAFT_497917 [Phascolomyces articulosus]